jgi:hypothetical protein
VGVDEGALRETGVSEQQQVGRVFNGAVNAREAQGTRTRDLVHETKCKKAKRKGT